MAQARPTLAERLRDQIAKEGPITVEAYMQACMADPQQGYYRTRNPLGAEGDFVTAPEISQIFGELLGLWSAEVWNNMGAPDSFHLVEMGPGRGTLMADALRALAQVAPGCLDAAEIQFVETSSPLRAQQKSACQHVTCPIHWHDRLNDIPHGPTILIANEFIDALPVRQFVKQHDGWHERMVTLTDDGEFTFLPGSKTITDQSVLPSDPQALKNGAILEFRPDVAPLIEEIARRATDNPMTAIFIDYGYTHGGTGDTIQAVKDHKFTDPLKQPGSADLTTHVDFLALEKYAKLQGLEVFGPMSQGHFLLSLGLAVRTKKLLAKASQEQAQLIVSGAQRLVDPEQMGALFKILVLASPNLPSPVPF